MQGHTKLDSGVPSCASLPEQPPPPLSEPYREVFFLFLPFATPVSASGLLHTLYPLARAGASNTSNLTPTLGETPFVLQRCLFGNVFVCFRFGGVYVNAGTGMGI